MSATNSVEKVKHLLYPESIAIVGASSRKGGWAEQIYKNLNQFGYDKPVYLINPRYETIWDQPCYPDLSSLPGKPDHLVILVPSSHVESVLIEGAKNGARSATIYAGGYGEGGDNEGKLLGESLQKTIQATGIAVSGPNCLGNLCGSSRMVTITDRRIANVEEGPVAIVGQSGGIVMAINRTLSDRGIKVGHMITTGNGVDLGTSDYIEYFAQDEQTQVIVVFIESVGNAQHFLNACEKARHAGKPVIAVKIGGTEQSRAAAIAHTGSLAGSLDAFDAIAGEAGVIRVDTLDEVIEAAEYVVHSKMPLGTGIGIMTISGGFKELLLEAAGRNDIEFPKLAEETVNQLKSTLPMGTSFDNPLDSGWGALSSPDIYFQCINLLLSDPNIGVLFVQEELPRTNVVPHKEETLKRLNELAKNSPKPISIVSMISHNLTDYSREFRDKVPHLSFLQESDKSLKTMKRIMEYGLKKNQTNRKISNDISEKKSVAELIIKKALEHAEHSNRFVALDEYQSKEIFKCYGIPTLNETVIQTEAEAVAKAEEIGYPIVLKGLSKSITHKTDAGIVKIRLMNEQDVVKAFREIQENAKKHIEQLDGILIAPFAAEGLEVVLGIKRDPEMGPMIMFGNGGIWLELYKDVSFGSVPIDEEQAMRMIKQTKVSKLLDGYRGDSPKDSGAVIAALIGLSHLAHDLKQYIESIDINPFRVFATGKGGVALDGLIVMRNTFSGSEGSKELKHLTEKRKAKCVG